VKQTPSIIRLAVSRCLICVGLVFVALSSRAQSQPDAEVLLTFNHPAIGQVYVTAAIFGETPYLPVGEVLSLVEIPAELVPETRGLQGAYPGPKDFWQVNPVQYRLTIKGELRDLKDDDFYLGELDLFLHPQLYKDLFGLDFMMNLEALTLSLKSDSPLPVEEKKRREQLRSRLLSPDAREGQAAAPMRYPRHRSLLKMGMIDYNLNQNFTNVGNSTQGFLNVGLEALGGDMTGRVLFNRSSTTTSPTVDVQGLRWRYVLPGATEPEKNVALTAVSVGDIFTTGQSQLGSIVGVSMTNDPIAPRRELDFFVIDGYTEADSEVEMLMGGQLVDFMRADEVGYFRFNAPINFGTLRLTLRIYTPQGKVIIEDRQLQIPFTFLPKGFVTYNVQAGLPRIPSGLGNNLVGHADVAYGVSNALTVRAGSDLTSITEGASPYSYLGLSARVFQQYLVNLDLVPNRHAETNGSVFFANNTSITARYKEYFRDSILNPRNNQRDFGLNYFMPFQIGGKFVGVRLGGTRQESAKQIRNSLQADLNTQLGRMVARVNFRGNLDEYLPTETEVGFSSFSGTMTGSLTYTLSRSPGVPVYVRGMFVRAQALYDPQLQRIRNMSFLLSQTLFKRGRLTLGYDRDVVRGEGQFQLGFLYDFNFFRTASQLQQSENEFSFQQSFSGSLAYDPIGNIIPNNRDQVNRSGVAVKLFIDSNDNGVHDEGEEIVPAKAAKLDRSATAVMGSDGIVRYSQLQSYWTYRLEVDVNALPDPTLAPKEAALSFEADPNHYKMIEIPLYRTGTMEGTVFTESRSGAKVGQGGLRVLLTDANGKTETLRTFTDGSFYSFGLIPGKYTLRPDPKQLDYIEKASDPGMLKFEIKALADGDYVSGLDFVLKDKSSSDANENDPATISERDKEKMRSVFGLFVRAKELAYEDKLEEALEAVDASLKLFITDQGLALKGSIYFLMGEEDLAWEYWELAHERNQEIPLPERNKDN
jgi:hypothetical protein